MTTDSAQATRMLFLGDTALTDGFQLIGFETWPDPTAEQLELVLAELVACRDHAFVILDSELAKSPSPSLKKIRAEGGRIVVTEVPSLSDPENFECEIDNQVQSLLGNRI
jgi:vacuolar-type H+-ATPase subunit F/Vma7